MLQHFCGIVYVLTISNDLIIHTKFLLEICLKQEEEQNKKENKKNTHTHTITHSRTVFGR